jgi:hypothetical protein
MCSFDQLFERGFQGGLVRFGLGLGRGVWGGLERLQVLAHDDADELANGGLGAARGFKLRDHPAAGLCMVE